MLSRTAENLYWLGRYLERADDVARLADTYAAAGFEQFTDGDGSSWDAVIETLGETAAWEVARAANPRVRPEDFIVYSTDFRQSVRSIIHQLRALARELREHISREVFEEINRLYLISLDLSEEEARIFTARVRRTVAGITGLFDHTVLRNEGSAWFRVGMYLERADMTSRIVDSKYFVILPSTAEVGGPIDRSQWMAVLRSASALEAFRKQRHEAVSAAGVADLLVFDPDFPRSLVFCVDAIRANYEAAVEGSTVPSIVHPAREVILLQLDLRAASVRGTIRTGLHEFIDDFQARLISINQALMDHIFNAYPDEASIHLPEEPDFTS